MSRPLSAVAARALPALTLLTAPAAASACPSCFGQADGPMVDAARLGIWLLLGVTVCLQGGFLAFFLYLRRRAARAARREHEIDAEWSRLQREWDLPARSGA